MENPARGRRPDVDNGKATKRYVGRNSKPGRGVTVWEVEPGGNDAERGGVSWVILFRNGAYQRRIGARVSTKIATGRPRNDVGTPATGPLNGGK